MGLPALFQKLFQNDGYGPKLKPSIIPFAASLASASSDDVASAGWVRSNYDAVPVFVDAANGDDSNDGLTLSAAVRTIGRALEIGFSHAGQNASLHIAAGTYAEGILLSQKTVSVTLLGNVTLNGYLNLVSSSFIIEESTYTFSIVCSDTSAPYGTLTAYRSSCFTANCPVSLTTNVSKRVISSYNSSCVVFNSTLNISVNNSGAIFACHDSSHMGFGTVSVTGTKCTSLFDCFNASSVFVGGSFTCANGVLNSSTYIALTCRTSSVIWFGGDATIYGNVSVAVNYFVYAIDNAVVAFKGATDLYFKPSSGVSAVFASASFILFDGSSLSIEATKVSDFVRALSNGTIHLDASTIKLNGSTSYCTVTVNSGSVIDIPSASTVTGTVTGGRRYTVGPNSFLSVNGAGANRIPGASAGYVNSGAFGYYS